VRYRVCTLCDPPLQVQLQLDGKLIAAGKPPRYSGTIDAFRTVAREVVQSTIGWWGWRESAGST
jgi:hypothetical protein